MKNFPNNQTSDGLKESPKLNLHNRRGYHDFHTIYASLNNFTPSPNVLSNNSGMQFFGNILVRRGTEERGT